MVVVIGITCSQPCAELALVALVTLPNYFGLGKLPRPPRAVQQQSLHFQQ